MTDSRTPSTDPSGDDAIGRLLSAVGPRKRPSEIELARLKRVAVERWERQVARRRLWRRFAWGSAALAASAALATVAVLGWGLLNGPATLGAVERVAGAARLGSGKALAPGAELIAGTEIETGPGGRLAVRLGETLSLRLDEGSRLTLLATDRVLLARGTVYVDSDLPARNGVAPDAPQGEPAIEIATPFGIVTDIGTRFEVAWDERALRVRVRDGRVALERGDERHEAEAGWQLLVTDGSAPVRTEIAVHGPEWAWVLASAPAFDLEGSTLGEFLGWVGRETGWSIALPSGQEEALRSIVLHGSLAGLTPAEAPELVLPGCGVDYRIADGVLTVGPPSS